MKKILFVSTGSLAHAVRSLFLATSLSKKNYDVVFASDGKYASLVKITQIRHYKIPYVSGRIINSSPIPLWNQNEIAQIMRIQKKILGKIKPNLVIGDGVFLLGRSCDDLKIPFVILGNSYGERIWNEFAKSYSGKFFLLSFWKKCIKPWNEIRKSLDLTVITGIEELSKSNYVMYPDIPSFHKLKKVSKSARYIGPITWFPPVKMPKWWAKLPKSKNLIYVSMGSSGDPTVLGKIIHAAKSLSVVLVITTAKKISLGEKYDNIYVTGYLPGEKVIKRASLVICNGGNGSVYQALKYGVPILAFPNNTDQRVNMELVIEKRCGIKLNHKYATPQQIKTAIEKLLRGRRYKKAAEKMACEIGKYDPKKEFLKFISDWENNKI